MKRQVMMTVAAAMFAVVGLILFIFNNQIIPRVRAETEENLRKELDERFMAKTRVMVVEEGMDIPKYTVLTDELIKARIKILEIPAAYAAKTAVRDPEQLRGKVAKEELTSGEHILENAITSQKEWFGSFERLKEYPVSSIVAGEVKTGNIIDILVSYGDGTYDVVISKTKVRKLVEDGTKAQAASTEKTAIPKPQDTKGAFTIIVSVDEEGYRDLEMAGSLGKLQTRLYMDENQTASPKTFSYEKALSGRKK